MKQLLISEELLWQVLDAACSPYCAQDLGKLVPAIKAALDAPAVEPDNLQCKSVQKRLATQWGYTQPTPQESDCGLDDNARIGWAMWRIKDLEQQLASTAAITSE